MGSYLLANKELKAVKNKEKNRGLYFLAN